MKKQIFKNMLIDGERLCEMTVTDGVITSLKPAEGENRPSFAPGAENEAAHGDSSAVQVYDCGGRVVLPGIVESHVHLDTAMTEGDPHPNRSGTLFEGIEI